MKFRDSIFAALLTFPAIAAAQWSHEIVTDPITDERIGRALVPESNSPTWQNPWLIVQCQGNGPIYIIVNMNRYLDSSPMKYYIRVDDTNVMTGYGSPNTEHTSMFVPHDIVSKLLDRMFPGNVLHARVRDFNGTHHDATFSLSGFTKHFTAACSWHPLFPNRD